VVQRERYARRSPEQRKRQRERQRERQHTDGCWLPKRPLLLALEDYRRMHCYDQETPLFWRELAVAADTTDRTLYRIRHEGKFVRLDTADRLAIAIGLPLSLIYPP
jgi:hypothetical protein